ncbi:translin [Condylostylus longicornis]|uniref:translin n=1 Tax=Condylostylus longicornis TaxID=2530218 RepID=UPI00244E341E|nr:translin [Condylostylus longicornis]
MSEFIKNEIFGKYQDYLNNEQELREKIRVVTRELEQHSKEAIIQLQVIHSDIQNIGNACIEARKIFETCKNSYSDLAKLVPIGQYYRYNDHWSWTTQRIIFLIALTFYLETGTLVSREEAASILGLKTSQQEGFSLDIEDYLMGVLQMASELSRFATNSVTLGDYERPLQISRFIGDLNSGFRLLNLKNDSLRKRYDALKYDVKKVEEVVYDISIRGLKASNPISTSEKPAE